MVYKLPDVGGGHFGACGLCTATKVEVFHIYQSHNDVNSITDATMKTLYQSPEAYVRRRKVETEACHR